MQFHLKTKHIFSLLILSLILTISSCNQEEKSSANRKVTTEKASTSENTEVKKTDEGKRIYKIHCIICHGAKGDMGASGAHNLTESTLGFDEQVEVVTNGRNTMTPYKEVLSEDQIKAVVKYISRFQK